MFGLEQNALSRAQTHTASRHISITHFIRSAKSQISNKHFSLQFLGIKNLKRHRRTPITHHVFCDENMKWWCLTRELNSSAAMHLLSIHLMNSYFFWWFSYFFTLYTNKFNLSLDFGKKKSNEPKKKKKKLDWKKQVVTNYSKIAEWCV